MPETRVRVLTPEQAVDDVADPGALGLGAAVAAKISAANAGKADKTYLSGVPVTFYGASLTDAPFNPPGGGWYTLAGAELGSGAVTTYGVGSMRTNHMLSSLVSAGTFPGLLPPKAGAVWPGVAARPGLVVNDGATTDAIHYAASGGVPTPITGAGGDRYLASVKNQHQGLLAYESSEVMIEQAPSASVVYFGPWVNKALAMPQASGGSVAYTTTQYEAVTITLTAAQIAQFGPLAGRGWLSTFQLDPAVGANAPIDVSIDGAPATRWTPTEWETYVGLGAVDVNNGHAVIPFQLPVDGAGHTISFQHAGPTGAFFYFDKLLLASDNPPPRAVMGSHTPLGGALWTAAQLTIWKNNWIKVEQKIREAVALFPNAIYVHSPLTAEGMQGNGLQDGFHLSNRGAVQRVNDLVGALRGWLSAYFKNHTNGDAALPVAPRKLSKYDIAGLTDPAVIGTEQVTQFTGVNANTPYVIPLGAKTLKIRACGAGSGGGSGRRGAAGTIRCGGGGGAAGGYGEWEISVAELTALGIGTLYVDTGLGGAGGAAVAANDTSGNAGATGASSAVKTAAAVASAANSLIFANTGGAGAGGTAAAGAGGAALGFGRVNGAAGASASATGLVGVAGPVAQGAGNGGGSGGGLTAADAQSAGGAGGFPTGRYPTNINGGAAGGGSGGAGTEALTLGYGGAGAGGGSRTTGGVGGDGGKGGKGSGGGGGGASLNGNASGAGGAGGDGFVEILALF